MRKITDLNLPPAPGELALVQEFINSANLQAETYAWDTPRALASWLESRGLLRQETELSEADRQRAMTLRELWRGLLPPSTPDETLIEELDQTVASVSLRVTHGEAGRVSLGPASSGFDGALGQILITILEAQQDGRWTRLKQCASPTCQAVFYDSSANRAGKWCRPRCGNRPIARRAQERKRQWLRSVRR